MRQSQQYFLMCCAILVLVGVQDAGAHRAGFDRIAPSHRGPDPLLAGSPAGPCDPRLWSPDYTGGTDVHGAPVAPADVPGTADVPVREIDWEQRMRRGAHVDLPVRLSGAGPNDTACPPQRGR